MIDRADFSQYVFRPIDLLGRDVRLADKRFQRLYLLAVAFLECMKQQQRVLAFSQIASTGLAELLLVPDKPQDVVLDLERKTRGSAEARQRSYPRV